ncbi:MAG: RrF2 family transcriptional regulator [Planctomycetota bacterium]|jgi:Rrf2 family protein
MRIPKKCEYALRALFELALRNTSQPVRISEIAGAQDIPQRFLEVILNQLRHAGFVESRRGSAGGYMLARAAKEITVGEVMEFMSGPLLGIDAKRGSSAGNRLFAGDCAFTHLWQTVDKAVSSLCHSTSFAELVEYEEAERPLTAPSYAI